MHMNIKNPLRRSHRKGRAISVTHAELPRNMLQLLGKSTSDEMINSFLRNTSITPLSVYDRLKQFREFYGDELWNIPSAEASGVLEAFKKAHGLIFEEDRRTGINTCKGFCKKYGIRCMTVDRAEFAMALLEAEKAIYRRKARER